MLTWELARGADGTLSLTLEISPDIQPTEVDSVRANLHLLTSLMLAEVLLQRGGEQTMPSELSDYFSGGQRGVNLN